MMNTLARAILTLYCYDNAANDISLPNALRQCLQLIANTPQLAIYSYQAYRARQGHDLYLHVPNPELSMAENILYLLRADKRYPELEARALDAALILHADHGSDNYRLRTTCLLVRDGHLFRHHGLALLAEGAAPRRREHQGRADDRRPEGARQRLDERGADPQLSRGYPRQARFRRQRPDLRHRPRGLLPLRPARRGAAQVRHRHLPRKGSATRWSCA